MTNAFIGKKGIELRFTPGSGVAVASYSIAVPNYKKAGEDQTYTYVNCVTWNKQGEFLANNAERIKKIGVIGRISTRSYDAKDGTKKYITEIITEEVEVEEWKNEGSNQGSSNNEGLPEGLTEDPNSDIPF